MLLVASQQKGERHNDTVTTTRPPHAVSPAVSSGQ